MAAVRPAKPAPAISACRPEPMMMRQLSSHVEQKLEKTGVEGAIIL
jgi:hypothetical protein